MIALLWLACGPDASDPHGPGDAPARTCGAGGEHDQAVVIRTLTFVRAEDGVSDGFDLDGTDDAECGIADFVSSDGEVGIDNSFANLLPALELTEAAAVESLVQAAIDAGDLLITLEIEGLDDPVNDDCVALVLGRGAGVPMVGTDGRLLDGQTIDRSTDVAPVRIPDVKVVDGVFEAPFAIVLPVQIFEVHLEFELVDGRIRGAIEPDGTVHGVFGGGVDIGYLLQIALEENVDPNLHGILESLLYTWADLAPGDDGQCEQVSIGFDYTSTEVFFFADPPTSASGE